MSQKRLERLLIIVVAIALVTAVLGWSETLYGIFPWQGRAVSADALLDITYKTIQLFGGEFDSDKEPTFLLRIARLLAILSTAAVAVYLVWVAMARDLFAWRRRFSSRETILLVGYGVVGRGIARALAIGGQAEGRRIVAIAQAVDDAAYREARSANVELYAGDVGNMRTLDDLPLDVCEARRIFVALGSDADNIAAASGLAERLAIARDRIWIHVTDHALLHRLRDASRASEVVANGQTRPHFFSLSEASAEYLSIHRCPTLHAFATEQPRMHAVVMCMSDCAWHVVEQLLLSGTMLPPRLSRPRITIIDPQAESLAERWRMEHPEIWRRATVGFEQAAIGDMALNQPCALLDRIELLDPVSIYVFGDAEKGLPAALAIRHGMEKGLRAPAPVAVFAQTALQTTINFGQAAADLQDDLLLIGEPERVASVSVSLNRQMEKLARAIHDSFEGPDSFDDISETMRISNRRAALHMVQKCSALGFEGVDPERPAFGFGSQMIADLRAMIPEADDRDHPTLRQLANFEHVRWCVDRSIDGWTSGPADDEARRRPQLAHGPVRYEELDDGEKVKDRRQLLAMVATIADAGQKHASGSVRHVTECAGPDLAWRFDTALTLALTAPIAWQDVAPGAADRVTRIMLTVPPEPPLAAGETPAKRATARRLAYRAFAKSLAPAPSGIEIRLRRRNREGWNWLGALPEAGSGQPLVTGFSEAPLSIGFAGWRGVASLSRADIERLRSRLAVEVNTLRAAHEGRPLRLVTGLADGADALMLELWHEHGWGPILGISANAASETPRRELADTIWQIGPEPEGDARYEEVAQTIIDSCTHLIVVDAKWSSGDRGGTAWTARRAALFGCEVVAVDHDAA